MTFACDTTNHKCVIYAQKRKGYKPPADCPFCPEDAKNHLELFRLNDVRVIANDFPRLEFDEVRVNRQKVLVI